jgi:AhpD family alkylhydroperoxidase
MTTRLDPFKAAPGPMKLWMDATANIAPSLEHSLLELVKIRASQINGCANCLNMHTRRCAQGAGRERAAHLSAERLARRAVSIRPRERAALAWTDALTLVSTDKRAPAMTSMTRSQGAFHARGAGAS